MTVTSPQHITCCLQQWHKPGVEFLFSCTLGVCRPVLSTLDMVHMPVLCVSFCHSKVAEEYAIFDQNYMYGPKVVVMRHVPIIF